MDNTYGAVGAKLAQDNGGIGANGPSDYSSAKSGMPKTTAPPPPAPTLANELERYAILLGVLEEVLGRTSSLLNGLAGVEAMPSGVNGLKPEAVNSALEEVSSLNDRLAKSKNFADHLANRLAQFAG